MEVGQQGKHKSSLLPGILWKEPKPFTTKKELNTPLLIKAGATLVILAVVILLCLPTTKPPETTFHEKAEVEPTPVTQAPASDPSRDTWAMMQAPNTGRPASFGSGIGYSSTGGGSTAGVTRNLNSAMILTRGGLDSRTQLPPGTRFFVRLLQKATVANQTMPAIGLVTADIVHDSDLAIPGGTKLFGDITFDEGSERAQISWKSMVYPDGKMRELSAIGVGSDGQVGIEGDVHSDALKNTIGATLTTFIGAFADGSMTRTQTGQSAGGAENGLKNAVGETAKDRARAWGEDLKKSRKWIELEANTETTATLTAPFVFRDPGSTH